MNHVVLHDIYFYSSSAPPNWEGLRTSVESLTALDLELRDLKETIYKHDNLYEAEVAEDIPLWRLLYEDESLLGRDLTRLLQLSVDSARAVSDEQLHPIPFRGSLGLYDSESGTRIKCISEWLTFRRNALKTFNGTDVEFLSECRVVFPDLAFSQEFPACLETFNDNFQDFVPLLVECFDALSSKLRECLDNLAIKDGLRHFGSTSGFETSMEGDPGRKAQLTFKFIDAGGVQHSIVCEPHMKLERSERPGDSAYYFYRIYFSPRLNENFPGRIFIGHAGKHL